jgi:hypothetical protein
MPPAIKLLSIELPPMPPPSMGLAASVVAAAVGLASRVEMVGLVARPVPRSAAGLT